MLSNLLRFLLSNIFIALVGLFTPCLWLSAAAGEREGGPDGGGAGLEKSGTRVQMWWRRGARGQRRA